MNEKDKAVELFKKYYCLENNSKKRIKVIEFDAAKQCAKIAVEEILNSRPIITDSQIEYSNYWNQVLKEIDLI